MMKKTTFKTTIQCGGCISKVTPYLNEAVGKDKWEVNLHDSSKTLTVLNETDVQQVIEAVQKAGFSAERN